MKNLYLKVDFLNGLFLSLIGMGLGVITFLIFPKIRKDIFSQKFNQKISTLLVGGQIVGGVGVLFQQYAIFLAEPIQVPLINALEGVRYAFLLFFVFILSFLKPQLLKEEIKGKILIQKIVAILLIGVGLIILSLR